MAGHGKWSKVKHIKGPLDAKHGVASSKRVKETVAAVRLGGDDCVPGNFHLRSLVGMIRAANRPEENVERANKQGTGEWEGAHDEETLYEGYAPGGVALVIEAATDHKNRTAVGLRLMFSKNGGSLAAIGGVLYQFHRKGQSTATCLLIDEDRIPERALDAGTDGVATGTRTPSS